MSRFAIIEGGTVANIVEAEADFAATQGWIEARDANIGDLYADGLFTKYEPTTDPVATAAKADFIRKERNGKLSDSDWTQVADAPVDKAAWAAYRQALRDITSQPGFPWTIEWPEQP